MFKKLIIFSIAFLAMLGCQQEYKVIKEPELKAIIKDILFVDAYLSQNKEERSDSVEYFSHIFDKYGYTVNDLQHTISRYGLRKSSVLGAMLDEISMELDSLKKLYNYKGMILENWDNTALENRARVIYFRDSLIFTSREQLDTAATISLPINWSGTYAISYKYTVDSTSEVGPYSLVYQLKDTLSGTEYKEGRYWMVNNQNGKKVTSTQDLDIYKHNLLEYTLPHASKDKGKVNFRIDSLKVVYLPFEEVIDLEYLGYVMRADPLGYISSYYYPTLDFKSPYAYSDSLQMEYNMMVDSITSKVRMEQPVPFINNKIDVYEKDMRTKGSREWKNRTRNPLSAGR